MRESEASSTALIIAGSFSYLSRTGCAAAPVPPASRTLGDWLLGNYSPITRTVLRCLDHAWFRAAVRALESLTLPHILEHYAARKHVLERLFRESAEIRQLVVLGAGFDTLALRMVAEFSELTAIEIDHPATQAWKSRAVAACHADSPRLHHLPLDFSRPLPESAVFPAQYHQRDAATFWIAEGLLMYLPVEKVVALLRLIHDVSAPGSRITFTFMEPQRNGRIDFIRSSRSVHFWLSQHREPFAWGIRREDLASFLAPLGFRLLTIPAPVTQEVDRLNVGEYIAYAEVIPA